MPKAQMANFMPALILASLVAGCAAPPPEPPLPYTVTLPPAATLAFGAATLHYVGAVDSRCPQGVTCIWAGEIRYQLTLAGPAGTEAFDLTRTMPAHDASTVKGLRFALVARDEPPVLPPGAPTARIPVTLTISRP